MGMFLNSGTPALNYREIAADPFFVDKTKLLEELLPFVNRINKYLCFTRPRRFGKSVMANMVATYFGKTSHSRELFDELDIASWDGYPEHLNQYDVIYVDFSRVPKERGDYQLYIKRVEDGISQDLGEAFPELNVRGDMALWDILEQSGKKFIFVLDEWDAVFHMRFMTQADKDDYLLFLKNLLKDKPYVALAYMTGVLPIAKYSSGSELNMFAEFNIMEHERFSNYFGFSDEEVDALFHIYLEQTKSPRITREELRIWYDGYYAATGKRLYNPRSIVSALSLGELASYWTSSGPYDEIFYYIKENAAQVRDDIALMVAGERIPSKAREYAATAQELETKDQIYSAMVVYGLLTYYEGEVFIPNKELMDKFNDLLLEKKEMGYVHQLAGKSRAMLQATLAGDTDTMAEIMDFAHNTESPILQYNSEVELAAVVNLTYLAARDDYRVVREEKAGKGFADFLFYPYKPDRDCVALELKVNALPEEAILQIRQKGYALNFTKDARYTGRILLVGIGYDTKSKSHQCRVEVL